VEKSNLLTEMQEIMRRLHYSIHPYGKYILRLGCEVCSFP